MLAPGDFRSLNDFVAGLRRLRPQLDPFYMDAISEQPSIADLHRAGYTLVWLNPECPVPFFVGHRQRATSVPALKRRTRALAARCGMQAAVFITLDAAGTGASLCVVIEERCVVLVSRAGRPARDDHEVWGSFGEVDSWPTLAARLARLIERRDIGRAFFVDVRRELAIIDRAWVEIEANNDERRRLTITVFCRLMFVFFIQSRGWLGSPRFVQSLVFDPQASDIYTQRLRPLFFDALNRPVGERSSGPLFDDVPYLNGGLFAPTELELAHPNAALPDAEVRRLFRRIFDRYRFVGDEAGRDAAIDPEMLGSVFEELMCSAERGRSGAYYTPVSLVRETVGDAIKRVLGERIPAATLRALRRGEALSRDRARSVIRAIDDIRCLDPAVGSGAFLLGVLEELSALRSHALVCLGRSPEVARRHSHRRIISHCLFGVDVSATAVMLCELRLWLALAAVSGGHVEALPNLDHHIRQGNSLISSGEIEMLDRVSPNPRLADQVGRLHEEWDEARGQDRSDLRMRLRELRADIATDLHAQTGARISAQIADLERGAGPGLFGEEAISVQQRVELASLKKELAQLEAAHADRKARGWSDHFDPRMDFADVLARGGFDLVVGNPPWVRLAAVEPRLRVTLKKRYRWMRSSGSFGGQADLSVAFVERSLELLADGGLCALIVPAKLFRSGYAGAMRAGLLRDHTVVAAEDLSETRAGAFHADVFPARLVLRRSRITVDSTVDIGGARVRRSSLRLSERADAPWPLLDEETADALRAMAHRHPTFGRTFKPRLGVKTGCNRVFIDTPQMPLVVDAVRGSHVRAFRTKGRCTLLFAHDKCSGEVVSDVPTEVLRWVTEHESALRERADAGEDDALWTLFRVPPDALGWRVVWRDIARTLEACALAPVAEGGAVALNTSYVVAVPDRRVAWRVAAWLNSAPARAAALSTAERALSGYRRFLASVVSRVPAPTGIARSDAAGWAEFDQIAAALAASPLDAELLRRLDDLAWTIARSTSTCGASLILPTGARVQTDSRSFGPR